MASISAVTDAGVLVESFFAMQGRLVGPGVLLEERTPAGAEGVSYKRVGRKGAPVSVVTFRDYAPVNAGALAAIEDLYAAFMGNVAEVVDSHGVSRTVVVLDVRVVEVARLGVSSGGVLGGSGTHLVTAVWVLQRL